MAQRTTNCLDAIAQPDDRRRAVGYSEDGMIFSHFGSDGNCVTQSQDGSRMPVCKTNASTPGITSQASDMPKTTTSEPLFSIISAEPEPSKETTALLRRRAQNRASQRAFRKRKEETILRLNRQLVTVTMKYAELTSFYIQQCEIIEQLRTRMTEINADLNTLRCAQAPSLEQQTYWNSFAAFDAFTATRNPAFSQASSQPAAHAMVSVFTIDPSLSQMEALVDSEGSMNLRWDQ